jgi:hypothetical protein
VSIRAATVVLAASDAGLAAAGRAWLAAELAIGVRPAQLASALRRVLDADMKEAPAGR